MSKKPLENLPEEKKAKLLMLIKAFNLDTTQVAIKSGPNMGHWVKKPNNEWVVLRDSKDNLLWPFDDIKPGTVTTKPVAPTGSKPGCKFNPEDYVNLISDPKKFRYQVKEVIQQSYGRTGFWCVLVHGNGSAAFKKAIESAELEACPIEYAIGGENRLCYSGQIGI